MIGFSSMYSSPYFSDICNDSSSKRLLRKLLLSEETRTFFDPPNVSGNGVFSLLACDSWESEAFDRFAEGGGIYVCPREGEKSGRAAAVETNLLMDEIMVSYDVLTADE